MLCWPYPAWLLAWQKKWVWANFKSVCLPFSSSVPGYIDQMTCWDGYMPVICLAMWTRSSDFLGLEGWWVTMDASGINLCYREWEFSVCWNAVLSVLTLSEPQNLVCQMFILTLIMLLPLHEVWLEQCRRVVKASFGHNPCTVEQHGTRAL